MTKDEITIEFLRECFDLDRNKGIIYWRARPAHHFPSERWQKTFNTRLAGKEAAQHRVVMGYYRTKVTTISGVFSHVHRIIYALDHGLDLKDVPPVLDHKDGDSLNNRPDNLRPATQQQNCWNSKLSSKNKSGFKGVYFRSRDGLWYAQIRKHGRYISLGRFTDREDAAVAYQSAARDLHGEFARF